MKRVIAIDWSGAKSGARSRIWLAEVRDGRLTRLESGRDRREVIKHVIDDVSADPDVVVGLDFAFSFPSWFVEQQGTTSIEELWDLVDKRGEEWLRDCPHPFWGRPGKRKPDLTGHLRLTEQRAPKQKGVSPKSIFQIGGAGAVGTGSIRGMPHLARLREAELPEGRFSIWPFHEVQNPLVIEIYPRLLTGPVNKSDHAERKSYLARDIPEIGAALASEAASSEDAFDAAVSAVAMHRHLDEIATLTEARDPTERIEGSIWWPREVREAAARSHAGANPPTDCPFCDLPEDSVVAESRHAFAIRDRYPVSRGHTLVIPRAHSETLFDQGADTQADLWRLVAKVRDELQSEFSPDGFNIGLNEGQVAGQTMEHAHVHLIPRFPGDVADPRGGIRWVLPERAAYWDE
jgi:diadenosine tetraphosphate (Ap4A) HIT family hydrolase